MAKFLYFRDTASSQYIVPVERLLGVDDTGSNTVVVQFEDMGGAASSSVVTLNVVSGKEKDVMVALLNRVHNEKSDVLIVADDVDSNYMLSDISSIASIAHNQTSASGALSVGANLTVTGDIILAQDTEATSADDTSAVTAANILTGVVKCTPTAARAKATDTAANLVSGLNLDADTNSFDFSFINLAASTHAVTLSGGTGVTLVGSGVIAAASSARFRAARTGASAVTLYRLA